MASDIADIKSIAIGACERSLPIWVFKWICGPTVALILGFTAWTAIKGLSYGDRIFKVELQIENMVVNQTKLLEHFNLEPEPLKKTK